MGWTATYQVVRARPLDEAEIRKVADYVRMQRKQPWDAEPFQVKVAKTARADHVIVDGFSKLSMDEESGDMELLEAALAGLVEMLGGELRASDDFGAFTTPQPIDVPYGELDDPEKLAPPEAVPVTTAGASISELIAQLVAADANEQKKALRAELARRDAREVALHVYDRYAAIGKSYEARDALADALRRLDDAAPVARAFIAAWREPTGTYFYGDMPIPDTLAASLVRVPEVEEQLVADVAATATAGDDGELPYRRAERALGLLARSPNGARAVVRAVRELRGRELPWRRKLYVFVPAHRALGEHGDARVVPTLLHYLGSAKDWGNMRFVLEGLVRLAPERTRPHLFALAELGTEPREIAGLLRKLGDDHAVALANRIVPAQEPDRKTEPKLLAFDAATLAALVEEETAALA